MQVEHVTGVRLAARGTTQQQRHLTVGLGLLRQVVVHHESVLAVLHPVLAHGATGVGGEVLERCRVRSGRHHDDRVLERSGLTQNLHGLGHGGTLLTDGHVDALHTLTLLVQDGVDGHGGLAGLAVTDDELALTTTDGGHGVDGLDAGLHGLVHGLATHDAGSLDLHTTGLHAHERTLAVDGLAERVHHATQHALADGHRENLAGGLDGLALFDAIGVTQHHGADGLFFEVQRQTLGAVLELEQLVHGAVGQARDARDSVADLCDATHGAGLERRREALEVLLDGRCDVGC